MRTRDVIRAVRGIGAVRGGLVGAAVLAVALFAPAGATAKGVPGPTDVEVTEVTSTSFTLTWSEAPDTRGLYGYSVRAVEAPFAHGWSFETTETVEAEPDKTYKVVVRASYINHPDGIRESKPSEPVTVTTPPDTEPPETPDALDVQRREAHAVVFWSGSSLANDNVDWKAPDYVIEVNGGERFVEVRRGRQLWGVRDLESNTTHSFRVKAIDSAGNESGWSDPVSVAIEDEPPTVPTNIRVEGDLAVWDPSTDNSGQVRYEVFFDGDTFNISGGSQPQDDFEFWTDVAEAYGPGDHLFTVEAIDSSSNRSGPSEPFVITVD